MLFVFAAVLCSQTFVLAQESAAVEKQEGVTNESSEQDIAPVPEDDESWYFRVYADQQYRLRTSTDPGETDQDLRLYLNFGAADPSDHFGADFSMGFWWDLDGDPNETNSTFVSAMDNDPPVWLDVYKLSVDYHSDDILRLARVGRQVTLIGKDATFDGATLEISPVSPYFDIFLMGGRSVHFFELDQGIFEDWMAGAGFVVRPFRDLRLELDYRFTMEDFYIRTTPSGMEKESQDIDEHSIGLGAWYRYDDWFRLHAFMRSLNDAVSEAGGATHFEWLAQELGLDLAAKAQTTSLNEINEAEDAYASLLGESLPYVKFSADAWKGFTSIHGTYGLHLGYEGRYLTEDDETTFNRNSGRVYFLFTANDIGVKGPFITAVFERWADGPGLDSDGLWSGGGSVGYDIDVFRGEVGSHFQRFKYDYYLDVDERSDVRTVFVDLKGRVLEWLYIKGRYEFERFDRDVHTVTIGLSQVY